MDANRQVQYVKYKSLVVNMLVSTELVPTDSRFLKNGYFLVGT